MMKGTLNEVQEISAAACVLHTGEVARLTSIAVIAAVRSIKRCP